MSNVVSEKELNEFLIEEGLAKEQDCDEGSFEEEDEL